MFYARQNYKVFFFWPSLAFGYDLDETIFIELAWMFYVIGIGQQA
jgi:hypothetical protein